MRKISGEVQEVRCNSCGSVFHHFLFSGEDDAETAGLCSASRRNIATLVIAEATPDEWRFFGGDGLLSLEARLASNLNMTDLKVLRLLRVEQSGGAAAGKSFQDFLHAYKPPTLVYACPACNHGEASVIAEYTTGEFQARGGKLVVVGDLSIE